MQYINRYLEKKLLTYIKQFPITVLTGPRQSGKSTLLKHLLNNSSWEYINLDQRGTLARIDSDPDLFAKDIQTNIIIDEAQKAPNLFHSLKWRVDQGLKYKIVLSGSANFHLLHKVTETLAGRAGILQLYPFSLTEKFKKNNILEKILTASTLTNFINTLKTNNLLIPDNIIYHHMLWGGFPKVSEYKNNAAKINWFESYRTTYIEKDLRDLSSIENISDFQKFYQMLAFQTGQIINLSNIANNLGITLPTCKKYLQILEASYQYFILPPYHVNIGKRLIKRPKIYATDTGLCNHFLGLSSLSALRNYNNLGNIFETLVISELIKQNTFLNRKSTFHFWRTSNGAEVDLVITNGQQIIPIEIKHAISITNNSIRGILDFMTLKLLPKPKWGIVFYRGDKIYRINEKIVAVPVGFL